MILYEIWNLTAQDLQCSCATGSLYTLEESNVCVREIKCVCVLGRDQGSATKKLTRTSLMIVVCRGRRWGGVDSRFSHKLIQMCRIICYLSLWSSMFWMFYTPAAAPLPSLL